MEHSELLRYVVATLERLELRYLITGSTATIAFGEPRLTNDIDVVVELPPARVTEFCRAFPGPDFYLSEEAVREAVQQHGQFNIIHPTSGLKVDVIVPEDTPFNRGRLARARRVRPAADYDASFASIEDVIIKKMEYYRDGGSEKHLRDITGVLKISGDQVDHAYIAEWASRMRLEPIWEAVRERMSE
ncbi:MAG: hypothetical protein GY842_07745 [bacterium]|nr:hypothetical protein [bacterium]